MKFTKAERKWILETIKYDVINSSYKVLRESGIPTRNIKINLKNEKSLLENYFKGLSLHEANIAGTVKNIFKGLISILTDLLKIAAGVVISLPIYKTAKSALSVLKDKVAMKNAEIFGTDPVATAGSMSAQVGASNVLAKTGADAQTSMKVMDIAGKFGSIIGKISSVTREILIKIGISDELATAITPVVLGVASIAAMVIIVKLLKLIVAGIKKLFSMWKANGKKKDEKMVSEAKKMASTSIKMQEQAASKIKDPENRRKFEEKLKQKKKRLASV